MRYNLLRMTQLILSSMDSDEVNSISDTTEAQQVVDILETTYYDLAATLDFPDHWDFFSLEASTDMTKPTLLQLPVNVGRMEWVQYDYADSGDTVRDYKGINSMPREEFFSRMNGLDTNEDNVYSFNLSVDDWAFDIRGYNDRNPQWYTTNNDRTILFDNYDSSIGQTIQASRTHCYGMLIPDFDRTDEFVPDLEPRHFTLYFNEAKAQCFADLKQVANQKAEQKARRGWVSAHRKSPTTNPGDIYSTWTPNFGRRR